MEPAQAADPLMSMVFFLFMIMLFSIPIILLAKDKGRNMALWIVLALIPVVNYFFLIYAVGASNKRLEDKIDKLLESQGKD